MTTAQISNRRRIHERFRCWLIGGVPDQLAVLTTQAGAILARLGVLLNQIDQINQRVQQLTADVASRKTFDDGLITALKGKDQQIADLRQQVANLGGNGVDPTALQEVLDQFDAQNAANEAELASLVAAVQAGVTPPATTDAGGTTNTGVVGPGTTDTGATSGATGATGGGA